MGYDGNLKKNNCNFELYKLCIAVIFYNVWRLWSYKVRRSKTQAVHWVPARWLLCLMVENHRLCHFVAEARACKQVVSSKVPAFRLLLANCGFHDWSAHAQMIFTYFTSMSYILWVLCHIPWQIVTHIVCGPHMCHICAHICGTYVTHMWYHICATYVSHLVPHMCHNLYQISVTFCQQRCKISVKLSNASFEPLYYSKYLNLGNKVTTSLK